MAQGVHAARKKIVKSARMVVSCSNHVAVTNCLSLTAVYFNSCNITPELAEDLIDLVHAFLK